jgi:hypothetical protein
MVRGGRARSTRSCSRWCSPTAAREAQRACWWRQWRLWRASGRRGRPENRAAVWGGWSVPALEAEIARRDERSSGGASRTGMRALQRPRCKTRSRERSAARSRRAPHRHGYQIILVQVAAVRLALCLGAQGELEWEWDSGVPRGTPVRASLDSVSSRAARHLGVRRQAISPRSVAGLPQHRCGTAESSGIARGGRR